MIDQEGVHNQCLSEDMRVRIQALDQLESNFPSMPNREQAWNDLHRLTNDENISVRSKVASALWSVFSQIPDKQQVWNDLQRLANDQDKDVRVYANHSLGRISIFKASQAVNDEDYKKELENAISFFEKASKESVRFNPSEFCLPFYRSFHTIIFKKENSQEEVNKYLADARDAVKGSKSKELLFEAVENLACALKEVQNLENLDLEAKKGELNFYRKYCDRAAELIVEAESTAPSVKQVQNLEKINLEEKGDGPDFYRQHYESYRQYCDRTVGLIRESEETAPFAIAAMRKGLPILDKNLKNIIEEIKEKAKGACKESKGIEAEEIACAVNREVQKWEIGSQEEMAITIERLLVNLESMIPNVPENKCVLDDIKEIRNEKNLVRQYEIMLKIVQLVPHLRTEKKEQTKEVNYLKVNQTFNIALGSSALIIGCFIIYFIISAEEYRSIIVNNSTLIGSIVITVTSFLISKMRGG